MTAFEQEPGVGSSEGPGRRLRLAREKRRLSITEVGDALHLERGVVQALEDDDYEALPPATFTKGYLRSYARFLELDEEAILKSFRQVANREAERPLTAQVGRESRTGGGGGTAGWVVLVLVVVLAGGGWLVWSRGGDLPPWADTLLRGGEQVLDGGGSLVGADGTSGGDAASPAGGEAAGSTEAPGETTAGDDAGAPAGGTASNDTMDTLVEAAEPETPAAGNPASGEGSAPDPVGTADAGSDTTGEDRAAPTGGDGVAGGDAPDTAASTAVADTASDRTMGTTADATGGDSAGLGAGDGDFGGPLSEEPPEPGLETDEPAAAAAGTDRAGATSTPAGDGGMTAGAEEADDAGDDALASAATTESAPGEPTDTPGDGAAGDAADAGTDASAATGGDRAPAGDRETLVFTFTGESWMEVRDARGRRLLFGLVGQTGERQVSGVPPFDIVVGDVGRVSVAYEGDPVDLSEYTRGSVARLTLGSAQ